MRLDLTDKFILELSNTKDAAVFLGVARVLKVPVLDESKEPREFNDIFNDVLSNFKEAKKKRQKELLSILKKANKCEDITDGYSTKNPTQTVPNEEV